MAPRPFGLVGALASANRELLLKLAVIAVLMFGFGYAMVPMYRAICECAWHQRAVLSERRRSRASTLADGNRQVDRSRSITVEFDANAAAPGTSSRRWPCSRPPGRADDG